MLNFNYIKNNVNSAQKDQKNCISNEFKLNGILNLNSRPLSAKLVRGNIKGKIKSNIFLIY